MDNRIIKSDVLIVGSGAVGNATAYYLAKKGLKVIVIDKDMIASGSSVRNGGLNKMNTRGIPELSLGMYGINEVWPELSKEMAEFGVDIEFKLTGGFRTAVDENQMEIMKKFYPHAKEYGLNIEYLDGKELRRRVPYFSEKLVGAAYCKEDSRLNPLNVTLGLYAKARSMGVKFYDKQKAERIGLVCGVAKRVITDKGIVFEADKICVVAGYGSRDLLNSVDIDIPFIHPICEIFITEPVPKMLDEIFIGELGGYYGHQTEHGSFLFGGGSYVGEYQKVSPNVEYKLTPENVPSGVKGLIELFPSLKNIKIVRSWSGWHDRTVDNCSCIQAMEEIPGLYIACGFSGHGLGSSAPAGKVLSELVLEEKLGADISGLRFDRFKPLDAFTGYRKTK